MRSRLQTIVETPEFLARAKGLLTDQERRELVDFLAGNPIAGDLMQGTGGARKLRWAAKGRGKSGGARAITFYGGPEMPVFLLPSSPKAIGQICRKPNETSCARC